MPKSVLDNLKPAIPGKMEKPKTVLLVEDDENEQFFFIRALKGVANASLFAVAGNGMEALLKLSNTDMLPDIIFSDIHMPMMNGIDFLAAIKNTPIVKDIPIVILSSDTSVAGVVRVLGASAFIKKTSDLPLMRTTLHRFIHEGFAATAVGTDSIIHIGF